MRLRLPLWFITLSIKRERHFTREERKGKVPMLQISDKHYLIWKIHRPNQSEQRRQT